MSNYVTPSWLGEKTLTELMGLLTTNVYSTKTAQWHGIGALQDSRNAFFVWRAAKLIFRWSSSIVACCSLFEDPREIRPGTNLATVTPLPA